MTSRQRIAILIGIATVLAWLVARQPGPMEIVAVNERPSSSAYIAGDSVSRPTGLPRQLDRPLLTPADRDPFVMLPPPAPVLPKQVKPVVVAPPPPQPPPTNLSFAGRITMPDGHEVIYMAYGDVSLPISVGQTLPNGYRVDAITAKAVELSYPPLNTSTRLELPEPPKYEIR